MCSCAPPARSGPTGSDGQSSFPRVRPSHRRPAQRGTAPGRVDVGRPVGFAVGSAVGSTVGSGLRGQGKREGGDAIEQAKGDGRKWRRGYEVLMRKCWASQVQSMRIGDIFCGGKAGFTCISTSSLSAVPIPIRCLRNLRVGRRGEAESAESGSQRWISFPATGKGKATCTSNALAKWRESESE